MNRRKRDFNIATGKRPTRLDLIKEAYESFVEINPSVIVK